MGKTQGERIDSTPAIKARTRLPIVIGEARSKHLVQQRGDGLALRVSDRSALLLVTLERDQCRLFLCAKALDQIFLACEIDHEISEVLEFRIGHELAEYGLLRLANGAPRSVNSDENRFPGLLRVSEGLGIERLGIRREYRRERDRTRDRSDQDRATCQHDKTPRRIVASYLLCSRMIEYTSQLGQRIHISCTQSCDSQHPRPRVFLTRDNVGTWRENSQNLAATGRGFFEATENLPDRLAIASGCCVEGIAPFAIYLVGLPVTLPGAPLSPLATDRARSS